MLDFNDPRVIGCAIYAGWVATTFVIGYLWGKEMRKGLDAANEEKEK